MDTPRIPPLPPSERDPDSAALIDAVGDLNIFATMANHPKLFKRWMVFGGHILAKNTLPPRERELVILRVGWRCGSEYEFGQHTIIGRRDGLTDDEIRRLAMEGVDGWTVDDAALVDAVDELVADHYLGDDTWGRLADRWSTQQLMDLVFTVGQYTMVSTALRTFGVQRDDGVPGFPT